MPVRGTGAADCTPGISLTALSVCGLGAWCRGSRGHQLCRDRRLFSAAFFQFLLLTFARAFVLPVFETIPQRQKKAKRVGAQSSMAVNEKAVVR